MVSSLSSTRPEVFARCSNRFVMVSSVTLKYSTTSQGLICMQIGGTDTTDIIPSYGLGYISFHEFELDSLSLIVSHILYFCWSVRQSVDLSL